MFDTVIVGGGSAGCVLAARLSEDPHRRVLLLEAGGGATPPACVMPAGWMSTFDSEWDWGLHTVAQPGCQQRRIYHPRGRLLGGSGAINAMVYMRGRPSDFAAWRALGNQGWDWPDVLPAFRLSEANARLGGDGLHGAEGPWPVIDPTYVDPVEAAFIDAVAATGIPRNADFNGPVQYGVGLAQLNMRNGERCGPREAFLAPAMGRANLSVVTDAHVTRLLVEQGRAVGVEYLQRGHVRQAHAMNEVVLAAGSFGSPHLLLLSGIGPADHLRAMDIEVAHDLPGVGADLQDHPIIAMTYHAADGVGIDAMTPAQKTAALSLWSAQRQGPMTSNWCSAIAHVMSRPDLAEPDLQIYANITSQRDLGRYLLGWPGVMLLPVLLRPASRGSVRLASPDPLKPPAIDPGYFSDAEGQDLAALRAGLRMAREFAATAPLASILRAEYMPGADIDSDAGLDAFITAQSGTLFHPTSSCRMGIDARAVVDPSLCVHGVEGLRIADASVMPLITSGNTNAATVMIAERAAAFIRAAA